MNRQQTVVRFGTPRKDGGTTYAEHGVRVARAIEDANGADAADDACGGGEALPARGVGGARIGCVQAHDREIHERVRQYEGLCSGQRRERRLEGVEAAVEGRK
jgi:hypothetical protein